MSLYEITLLPVARSCNLKSVMVDSESDDGDVRCHTCFLAKLGAAKIVDKLEVGCKEMEAGSNPWGGWNGAVFSKDFCELEHRDQCLSHSSIIELPYPVPAYLE